MELIAATRAETLFLLNRSEIGHNFLGHVINVYCASKFSELLGLMHQDLKSAMYFPPEGGGERGTGVNIMLSHILARDTINSSIYVSFVYIYFSKFIYNKLQIIWGADICMANENNLKKEDDLRNEDKLKNEDGLKNNDYLKRSRGPQK